MALSVDWPAKVITVSQADLTPLGGGVYEFDINDFRLELKDLEDGEGMPFLDTHVHVGEQTVGGVPLARVVTMINGYVVEFEDTGTPYAVNMVGANTNIQDVAVVNCVSIRPSNSTGLVGGAFPSASEVAGRVWDEDIADHQTAGSTGSELRQTRNASQAGL
jgi:hypothetical protein